MKYKLDISKWRCGGESCHDEFRLGKGICGMLNHQGFSDALGQFAIQLGCNEDDLRKSRTPRRLAVRLGKIYDTNFVVEDEFGFMNTSLSDRLMDTNDDPATTIPEKIYNIRRVLEEHGHELEVIGDYEQ